MHTSKHGSHDAQIQSLAFFSPKVRAAHNTEHRLAVCGMLTRHAAHHRHDPGRPAPQATRELLPASYLSHHKPSQASHRREAIGTEDRVSKLQAKTEAPRLAGIVDERGEALPPSWAYS